MKHHPVNQVNNVPPSSPRTFAFPHFRTFALLFLLLTCCGTISENLKDKSVNSGFEIYGLKLTMFDPATGSLTPTGWLCFGNGYYHSCPIKAGQSFKVTRRTKSFWTAEYNSEVIIECGEAPSDGALQVRSSLLSDTPVTEFIPAPPDPPLSPK